VVPRPATPSRSSTLSATIIAVSVDFKPLAPGPQPRLEHVRDLWQMNRPHRPQHVLTASIFETDTGRELRIGFNETNLIHSELSRKGEPSRTNATRLQDKPDEGEQDFLGCVNRCQ
jgi:hypothetical protein